ncbi:MAG TPA: hypothetical protein VEV44_13445, partial [Pseudoneobacillus sp.]|nr:hypothetical protein [Pseudoneobacillus sp.]
MKKLLAVVLMLVGIGIMLYPTGMQLYSSYMQEKLFSEWEKQKEGGNPKVEESYQTLENAFTDNHKTNSNSNANSQKSDGIQETGLLG